MTRDAARLIADQTDGPPGDLYDQLDPVGQRVWLLDDAWTHPSHLSPGLCLSDPQGHALLVGTNGRALTVLDMGGLVDIASVHVESPEVLEKAANRLRHLAERLRERERKADCAEEARWKRHGDI